MACKLVVFSPAAINVVGGDPVGLTVGVGVVTEHDISMAPPRGLVIATTRRAHPPKIDLNGPAFEPRDVTSGDARGDGVVLHDHIRGHDPLPACRLVLDVDGEVCGSDACGLMEFVVGHSMPPVSLTKGLIAVTR